YCETSGMKPSKLCEKLGLVKSDIYNSKYTPSKTDDSLVDGDAPMTVVDGKDVVASSKTPSEFTNEEGSSIASNPEFLERQGYDELNVSPVLIPTNKPNKWKKISMTAGSKTSSAFDEEDNKAPTAPVSIEPTKDSISWSGKKGDLIV